MRVGYSRISDERQAGTDPLQQARHELQKAGCDLILVEVGSGTTDATRPEFKRLRCDFSPGHSVAASRASC